MPEAPAPLGGGVVDGGCDGRLSTSASTATTAMVSAVRAATLTASAVVAGTKTGRDDGSRATTVIWSCPATVAAATAAVAAATTASRPLMTGGGQTTAGADSIGMAVARGGTGRGSRWVGGRHAGDGDRRDRSGHRKNTERHKSSHRSISLHRAPVP